MSDLFHECGIVAVYHLPGQGTSPLAPAQGPDASSRLMPQLLLDVQNRGQLAAGMTTYRPGRNQLIDTYKNVGTVAEVFKLGRKEKYEALMREYAGPAAIGHCRYATCGEDDKSYAQPFERHHIEKHKWFSFAFNGQLANYPQLRDEILSQSNFHLARETDTEILMHLLSHELSGDRRPSLRQVFSNLARRLDGAYNIVFLDAQGDMVVARDPLGIRPLCYAVEGPMFAAASESVALTHMGFRDESVRSLPPGHAVFVEDGVLSVERFAETRRPAHCFFEWIYFSNVASRLDDRSVYLVRKKLGEELAAHETVPLDADTIVVPVPDTAKAAAASMAYRLNVPWLEGLIRNRYSGRTFIEGRGSREDKAKRKYTPLPEVLAGKRVLLVEDSIVRSTTMRALVSQLRDRGRVKEVHVRVACPPILAPCFYGIDMSTIGELFAPRFVSGTHCTPESEREMAKALGADTLRYLPIEAVARSIGIDGTSLCRACLDTNYPTPAGQELYQLALERQVSGSDAAGGRTYDPVPVVAARL